MDVISGGKDIDVRVGDLGTAGGGFLGEASGAITFAIVL